MPIGWDSGPAATVGSLFGTSWKVYEGVNTGNGMTVVCLFPPIFLLATRVGDMLIFESTKQHSMLPDTQFSGSFTGDLKNWFEALVGLGRFTDDWFVNIGNAG